MSDGPYGEAQNALDFALDHIADAFERTDFLQCWRDGDVNEWPEYAGWLHANYRNEVLARADLMRRFGDCTKNDALTADSAPDTKQLCDWCALPLARPMPHETDEMVAALKNCRSYLTNFGSINPSELVQQIDDALATVELREANAIIGSEK